MGDAENTLAPSKKRIAGRQLTKDTPGLDDDEDTSEQVTGTFKKASDEVLASRRIVKVRRQQASAVPSAPSSNPFAGICLVPPTNVSAAPAEVTSATESVKLVSEDVVEESGVDQETEEAKNDNAKKSESKVEEAGKESNVESIEGEEGKVEDDKKLQSSADEPGTESVVDKEKNDTVSEATKPESADVKTEEVDKTKNDAKKDTDDNKNENEERNNGDSVDAQKDGAKPFSSFHQLSSNQNAFTGVAGSGFSSSTFSFGPISTDGPPVDSGFKSSTLFSSLGASVTNKGEGSGLMQEVTVETGEENEKAVFTADSVLFEFLDGGWKERGKGEIRVNVSSVGTGKARLVMRARGNYRLILNASLYSDMKLAAMEKKGVTFACMNSNGDGKKDGLSTYALKFKDASIVEEFRSVVTEHKGKTATGLKTPENSP